MNILVLENVPMWGCQLSTIGRLPRW